MTFIRISFPAGILIKAGLHEEIYDGNSIDALKERVAAVWETMPVEVRAFVSKQREYELSNLSYVGSRETIFETISKLTCFSKMMLKRLLLKKLKVFLLSTRKAPSVFFRSVMVKEGLQS